MVRQAHHRLLCNSRVRSKIGSGLDREGRMHYRDLREWLASVDSFGELRIVEGADWNQEIGAVAEVAARSEPPPAVL